MKAFSSFVFLVFFCGLDDSRAAVHRTAIRGVRCQRVGRKKLPAEHAEGRGKKMGTEK